MADYTTEPLVEKIARINAELAVQKAELKNELKRLKDEEKAIKATYKAQLDQLKSNKNDKHLLYDEVELEIERVRRKILLWAKSPTHINHKIVRIYLELLKQNNFVYLVDLENHSKTIKTFKSNFGQMKIICGHNHAKIFDVINEKVYLWEPIKSDVLKAFQNIL
jgi:hypothetical protein